MSRELVVQLIHKKKSLYQEQHDLALHELAVEEELAYCALEDKSAIEAKLREANAKKLSVESQLQRSQLFGLRYTHSFVQTICIMCFVDHGRNESLMVEIESSRGNGIRQYECQVCKHVLLINPV